MSGRQRSRRLLVWQLSDQLRLDVFKLTRRERLDSDHKLRASIEDAAGEVCRNIAEALATDRERDFTRFVRLARAAVNDVQAGFGIALMKKYLVEADLRNARELLSRLYPALSSLLVPATSLSLDRRQLSSAPSASQRR